MIVRDKMTSSPCCITKDTPISKALDIMSSNDFHRLPVVDENGKLIGLVTEGTISESTPSKATSLSIYELNYLLSKTKVEDLMIRDVESIGPDELLEEAAVKMRKRDIGVLPVVDEGKKVIGIITNNDIFDAFIDLLGYYLEGARYVVNVEDKAGVMYELCKCFYDQGANISNAAVYHNQRGTEIVVRAMAKDPDAMTKHLKDEGYNVTSVILNAKEK